MRHGRGNAGLVGHIERYHMGVATAGLDLGAQVLELVDPATGQHHARASFGQRAGKLGPQSAGSACDKGHSAGQIDFIAHGKPFQQNMQSCRHCAGKWLSRRIK